MNTIGIIAEFNPFHNGHLHLIESCRQSLHADRVVVIMSGDFVQRGAPSVVDKFTRTRMALECGVDAVIELPVYYALSSAEFFAQGAVSILDKLGCIDYLCFGSECGDLSLLTDAARILNSEPDSFKDILGKELKNGVSYAAARETALLACLGCSVESEESAKSVLSEPNNILGVEYIRALLKRNSKIKPYTIKRLGEGYHSKELDELSSASAIRNHILSNTDFSLLEKSMPSRCAQLLKECEGSFADCSALSLLLNYKLLSERENGYSKYLDASEDLSNKIIADLDDFTTFDDFCMVLKSKDLAYSRISRVLCHILLNIKASNMDEYKNDDYTSYARILGMKKASSDLIKTMRKTSEVPVIGNLKEADEDTMTTLQKRLLDETLFASKVYSKLYKGTNLNEYKLFMLI